MSTRDVPDGCGRKANAGLSGGHGSDLPAASEQDIADYVASGEPLDKAGAYGLQAVSYPHLRGHETKKY